MNVAIVIAGGVGSRMGQSIPKQFIEVAGKPVIVHTLETFENHPAIDAIEVVCLEGWEEMLRVWCLQFSITKLNWVTPGGATGQESIRNGVCALEGELAAGDIAVIHDGVRPMVDAEVLTDVVRVAAEHGNAVTSTPVNEQVFVVEGPESTTTRECIPRETLRRVSTPQAYRYGDLVAAYRRAFAEGIGITGSSYTNTMMVELGHELHLAAGSDRNIKLTTPENLETFRAWLLLRDGEAGR